MKGKILSGLLALAAAGWYCILWLLSAQPATASKGLSSKVLNALLSRVSPTYAAASAVVQENAVDAFTFLIRKSAHMTGYFLLGVLLFAILTPWLRTLPRRCSVVITLCALLATLDEYHQRFVPGRSGELRDIAIDTAGCALGVLLCLALTALWRTRRGDWRPAFFLATLATLCATMAALLPAALVHNILVGSTRLVPIAAQALCAALLTAAAGCLLMSLIPPIGWLYKRWAQKRELPPVR